MYPVTLWTSPLSIYELLAVEPEFTCWIIKVSFLGYRKEDLLEKMFFCSICQGPKKLTKDSDQVLDYAWTCPNPGNVHREAIFKFSYFENCKFNVRDILDFILNYLNGISLYRCKSLAGISQDHTSVNYAQFIRDIMTQKMAYHLNHTKLEGIIEIDETAFGVVQKYGRGDEKPEQIWILGLVERSSQHLYLFPIMNREEVTILKIVKQVCKPKCTIYTDGYASYVNLTENGFIHFSVNHKRGYRDNYIDMRTKKLVSIDTNRIENAFYHFKQHFRIRHGVKRSTFESHLMMHMWIKMYGKGSSLETNFFEHLRAVYPLTGPPVYSYKIPIFKDFQFPDNKYCANSKVLSKTEFTIENMSVVRNYPHEEHHPNVIVNTSVATSVNETANVEVETDNLVVVKKKKLSVKDGKKISTLTFTSHHQLVPSSKKNHISCPDGYMLVEKTALNLDKLASTSHQSSPKRKSTGKQGKGKSKVKKTKEIPKADSFLASVDSADEFQNGNNYFYIGIYINLFKHVAT